MKAEVEATATAGAEVVAVVQVEQEQGKEEEAVEAEAEAEAEVEAVAVVHLPVAFAALVADEQDEQLDHRDHQEADVKHEHGELGGTPIGTWKMFSDLAARIELVSPVFLLPLNLPIRDVKGVKTFRVAKKALE